MWCVHRRIRISMWCLHHILHAHLMTGIGIGIDLVSQASVPSSQEDRKAEVMIGSDAASVCV